MNRIINSLAIAEYNKTLEAVEVNFNGSGLAQLYHDTMDIAMNISLIHLTNRWLFIKDTFQDISHAAFLTFVKRWSRKASNLHREHGSEDLCKVALFTTPESYLYLMAEHDWLQDSQQFFPHLLLQLFTSEQQAREFLNKGHVNGVLV